MLGINYLNPIQTGIFSIATNGEGGGGSSLNTDSSFQMT